MPAALTHYCFVNETIPQEEMAFVDAVRLGGQGPDPWFFYGMNPVHKRENSKEIQTYGGALHHIDPIETYVGLMDYALASEDKELLLAYIDGLLLHYSLDRTMHPWIFAESGFDADGKLTGFYGYSHKAFEALLDVVVAKKKKSFIRPSKSFRVDEKQLLAISKMWAAVGPKTLKEDSFLLACKDFAGIQNLLQGKTGLKRIIWRACGKHSAMYGFSYPHFYHRYDKMDILNDAHRPWKDPATLVETTRSFDDMFEQAKAFYRRGHELLLRKEKGEDVTSEFHAWVANIDHDGTPIGTQKTSFSLCWDRMKS